MTHTPGPWKIDDGYTTSLTIGCGFGYDIAQVECSMSFSDDCGFRINLDDEEMANAHLIASAPELLEALEEMYEVCNLSSDDAPHRVKARAAIIKAGGVCR